MKDYETKGYTQYGAFLGRNRRSEFSIPEDTTAKLRLRRVRLDSGGYDKGGAYWGHGSPLWYYEDLEGRIAYRRAASRAAAKGLFPNARYWR